MGCLGLFRQVKFSVRLQHSVRFLHNSEGNLIEDKYLQGESSKNALVHFYCRTAVYCVLHNSKEMKILYDWRGMVRQEQNSLNYFGARYLDPMLGMWISVDPMRQFASPYLYAGNGYNPVNVVDPDGNTAYMSVDKNNVITYMMFDIDDNNTVEVTWGNGDISTFNGPDYDSYFYSLGSDGFPNIIGQKFDVNMELNARTMLNDVNPLAIWRWFSNKQYDFKYRYYGSGGVTNSVGVLNGTIMTARDVGNAIWAGYTRYMYLCRLGCNSPASIQNAYGAMVDIADFVAGGQEDRASASMQFWGFYNFKP